MFDRDDVGGEILRDEIAAVVGGGEEPDNIGVVEFDIAVLYQGLAYDVTSQGDVVAEDSISPGLGQQRDRSTAQESVHEGRGLGRPGQVFEDMAQELALAAQIWGERF